MLKKSLHKELSDVLNSSEEIVLPSLEKYLPLQTVVEPIVISSSTSVTDESDEEFDALLNRITPLKKEKRCISSSTSVTDESDEEFDALLNRITPLKKEKSSLNSTFSYNGEKNSTRTILPAKPWTVERSVRSMRLSSSPKKHITPLVFCSTVVGPKNKETTDAKSLALATSDLKAKAPLHGKSNVPVYNDEKSRIRESVPNPLKKCGDRYSFLESLSLKVPLQSVHTDALVYRKHFNRHKDELVKVLYVQYNSTIFNNKLPETMTITWNSRMTKTAGHCKYKRSAANIRTARIELSTKILDCAERVRDTLLHELCHAASWLIHGQRDGHGTIWKYWASRANHIFPELPVISRCHNYDIATKYVYRCMGCGGCIGRHSKSLNIKQKVCGCCGATFQLLIHGTSETSTRNSKPLSGFALYVKENYSTVKTSHHGIKHAEVMKELSLQFNALQIANK